MLCSTHTRNPQASPCCQHHIKPWLLGQAGQTRPSTLIPEFRGWHRAKTHAGFHVDILYPNTHLWITAAGQAALIDL